MITSSSLTNYLQNKAQFTEHFSLGLGPVDVLLRANRPIPEAVSFFPHAHAVLPFVPDVRPQGIYSLSYADPSHDGALLGGEYWDLRDRTFRAQRFSEGFYLTHHFGPPSALSNQGTATALIGPELARPIWGYYIKRVLLIESIRSGALDVKAACVEIEGAGALLVGRGQGGKTVATARMCLSGADFISNTHCLIFGNVAHGVLTSMRVRDDPVLATIIAEGISSRHLAAHDYCASPVDVFPRIKQWSKIAAIVVVDYDPRRSEQVYRIDASDAFEFLTHFAGAVDTYGMKDDVLEAVGGDIFEFNHIIERQESLLADLLSQTEVYVSHLDMMSDVNVQRLFSLIKSSKS